MKIPRDVGLLDIWQQATIQLGVSRDADVNCDQVMAVGSMTAGLLADALLSWGLPITRVRKAIQTAAFLIPAAALCVLANPGIISQSSCGLPDSGLGHHLPR